MVGVETDLTEWWKGGWGDTRGEEGEHGGAAGGVLCVRLEPGRVY